MGPAFEIQTMRRSTTLAIAMACTLMNSLAVEEAPIDVARGKQLMARFQSGEKLSAEEQAYLERVKQEMRRRAGQGQPPGAKPKAPTPSPAPEPSGAPKVNTSGLIPLTEQSVAYKGEDGGLYGGGSNEMPEAHRAAYARESQRIVPLDAEGNPSDLGKIGFITVGFSNPNMESVAFKRTADADPQKSAQLVIVNGCIGGRAAVMWAWDGSEILPAPEQARLDKEMDLLQMPKKGRRSVIEVTDKDTWPTLEHLVKQAGLAPAQVQVAWMKHVEARPRPLGDFPAHARALQADMADILLIAKKRYPNLRVVYFSSRTYAGWADPNCGSPEPFAYESGFGTRWLIQDQIKGNPLLNFDAVRGEVKAPLILWGPYLWAQGDTPRKPDGLTWTQNDVRSNDHMHPSESGCQKVADMLMAMLKTDKDARRWFLK